MLATEVGVLRALELAGKRARHTGGRPGRGELYKLTAWEVHTHHRLAGTHEQCDRLLIGVWDLLRMVLPDQPRIIEAADWYTRQLIVTGQPHRATELRRVLAVACEPHS
ncbi:hypothetical protein GFY24_00715 [Nocardia sp. SYP-A9097]|uniref:hypothetical protein n=1 Tax=Nocardia sp. SYP-A9097 TaxID=2663237 RepID=UPI00129A716D|nr:hypothetical protein [Nocardia sp. SYP-A9097]MRH85999.1 hypothetical protein [Nocardia sp. SYP-A9097]